MSESLNPRLPAQAHRDYRLSWPYTDLGIPDVRMHDLRQSMASNMVDSDRTIYEMAKVPDACHLPGGEITISARQEDDRVAIAFKDTGIGIKPGEMERIFQPFYTTRFTAAISKIAP